VGLVSLINLGQTAKYSSHDYYSCIVEESSENVPTIIKENDVSYIKSKVMGKIMFAWHIVNYGNGGIG
jgi:hypothetical protein